MTNRGRPPQYETPEEMAKDIEGYFEQADHPYTVAGLANALDMTRQALHKYEDKEDFVDTIKKAKQRIEEDINVKGLQGDYNPTMAIFNLKNNFGWEDRKKQEIEGDGVINVTIEDE